MVKLIAYTLATTSNIDGSKPKIFFDAMNSSYPSNWLNDMHDEINSRKTYGI